MSTNKPIAAFPSLSEKGWITDPITLASNLLLCALTTEKGQSNDFDDYLVSLPSLVVLYGKKPSDMAFETKKALVSQFKRYFEDVTVIVKVSDESDTRYNLSMDINFVSKGKGYNLGYSVFVSPDTKDVRATIDKFNG